MAPDAPGALQLIQAGGFATGQLSVIAAALEAAAAHPEEPVHRRLAALGLPLLVEALVRPSDSMRLADAGPRERVLTGCARLLVVQLDSAARAAAAAPPGGVEGAPAASAGARPAVADPESEETLLLYLSLLSQLLDDRAPLWNPVQARPGASLASRGTPPGLRALAATVAEAGGTRAVLGTAGAMSEAAALDTALNIVVNLSSAGAFSPARAETQAQVCEAACAAAAQAFGRLTGGSPLLRSEERFDSATATIQSLALLLPSDVPTSELPASSFRAVLAPRLALLSAAAGRSPLLLVRLRAVKEAVALLEQARVFGSQESPLRKPPLLRRVAMQLSVACLPAALLGPLAHETVLARAGPIFGLMRDEGVLDAPHLRALWRACACAPPPVSVGVAALVADLYSACKPDDALRDSLLDAIAAECAAETSPAWAEGGGTRGGPQPRGIVFALETLAPTFTAAAPPTAACFALLLLRLIAPPPTDPRRPMPELRPCLVSHLRKGPLRATALAAFCRPLQRECGQPVAQSDIASGGYPARGPAPRHRRSLSDGTALSSLKPDKKGGSPPLAGRGAPDWLPPTLADAADALPTGIAMRLVLEVGGSSDGAAPWEREGAVAAPAPLLVQAEAKFGLVALAHALVCAPRESQDAVAETSVTRRMRQRSRSLGGFASARDRMTEQAAGQSPGAPPARIRAAHAAARRNGESSSLLPAPWDQEDDTGGEGSPDAGEAALMAWGGNGASPAVEALCGRLSFYGGLCAQLRSPVSRVALEAAWEATRGDAEAAAFLLWLPSVLPQLAPDALDRAFLDYSLGSLRSSTLTLRQYAAFECIFRRYHVTKGNLRSVPPDELPAATPPTTPSGRFLPRLWRLRRAPPGSTAELAFLRAEALPSSLAGTEAVWRLLLVAPEATCRSAMPLLVQLHLRPSPTLHLVAVRHELLRGCTHALRQLCGKASGANAPPDANLRASLLLELMAEFISACGERRKLLPHRASWRGLTTRMTVHLPTRGVPVDAPALGEMLLPQADAEEQATPVKDKNADTEGEDSSVLSPSPLVHYGVGAPPAAAPPPAAPPPAAAPPPPPATPRSGIVRRVATYLPTAMPGATAPPSMARTESADFDQPPPERVSIQLSCHENTTVGQLKQQLKRRMVALGYPKPSYRCMTLLAPSRTEAVGESGLPGEEGWVVVRGEEQTLSEAGLTPDGRLSLQIHSAPKIDSPAHMAHPSVLLASSADYTPALFDAIRAFGRRAPAVAAQAWDLLMRVPTAHITLARIRTPSTVNWAKELAAVHTLPALYLLQAVRARLTPPDAAVNPAWAAEFMLHGLAPIFDAFVAAVARDGGALLAALLSIVRVCVGGYLGERGEEEPDSSDGGSPAKRPLPKLTDPLATPRHRGLGLATTHLHIVPAIALLPAVAEPEGEGASPGEGGRAEAAAGKEGAAVGAAVGVADAAVVSPALTAARMGVEAAEGLASNLPPSLRAPPPPGLKGAEALHLWALAQLLLFLIDRAGGSNDSFPSEHSRLSGEGARRMGSQVQRGIILDALKLLDAIACAHPIMAAPLLTLDAMPLAMSEALLATPDARTRRQACILLWDMCSVDRASLPRVLSLLEGLLPAAAANAPHTAQYWDLWHRLLSTPRAAQVAHSGADALRALVTAHLEPEPTKDKMPLGGTPGRMPPRGSRVAAGGEAGSSVEAESIVGPLRLLATQARASPQCAKLLASSLPLIYSACLIPTGLRQPPTQVRDAAAALIAAAAANSPACVAALLPPLTAAHARGAFAHASALSAAGARGGWGIDPASASRRDLVGLTNLGATCYMNALMQQLVTVPAFRDGLIAAVPLQRSAIVEQIQATLANLRDGLAPCYDTSALVSACEALPMTFSARQQNDAAEFLMLLMDHLEEKLKGTRQASLVRSCFGGKLVQQIVWEVESAGGGSPPGGTRKLSEREEPFLQIELPVKGHGSILEALKAMVEGERLEGDNAYQLENGVKVDATKRICIGELPATLIIQLKRFELDYESMTNQKLNSECAFPSKLDLEPFTRRGLECAARGIAMPATQPYELVGVLVHAGTSASGHYISYSRPRDGAGAGRWYEINDETVTATVFDDEAIKEACFGGMRDLPATGADAKAMPAERPQNAFMLFYRRPDSLHRRTGSAPPTGTRRERPAAASAPASTPAATKNSRAAAGQSVSFGETLAQDSATQQAATDASAAAATVVAANEALLLRQHLLSPAYANMMRELLRVADSSGGGHAAATLPPPPNGTTSPDVLPPSPPLALVQLGASYFFGHLLRTSGHLLLPYLSGYDAWPRALARACAVHMPAAAWLLHAMMEVRMQHETQHETQPATDSVDCAPPPQAATPPAPATPAPPTPADRPPCWLLDALFLCASPAARDAVASFTTSLLLTVHAAEAEAIAARRPHPPPTTADDSECEHTSAFLSALLSRGVDCATAHWRHAAPLWNLFSSILRGDMKGKNSLVASPSGSPTQPARATNPHSVRLLASRLGALRILPAYVIGSPAGGISPLQPAPGGSQAVGEVQPRMPDRRSIPEAAPAMAVAVATPMATGGASMTVAPAAEASRFPPHGDCAPALLESIALIIEAHLPPPPPLAPPTSAANNSPPSPPRSPRRAAYGPPIAPVPSPEADTLTSPAFLHAAAAMAVAPSALAPAPPASPVLSSALSPASEAASLAPPLDSLCRILRPLSASSLARSLVVLRALAKGLRHEPTEALASAYAPLLLHLLRIEDEHTHARCAAAMARPHGILALLLADNAPAPEEQVAPAAGTAGVSISVAPTDSAAAAAATGPSGKAGGSAPGLISDSSRCFLCLRLLLELHAASDLTASWVESVVGTAEVDQMTKWLKVTFTGQALGPAATGSDRRMLSFSRRRPAAVGVPDRLGTPRAAMESLKLLRKRVEKPLPPKTKAAAAARIGMAASRGRPLEHPPSSHQL